jgi:GH24 family phage-related lysozyme (muramidase)
VTDTFDAAALRAALTLDEGRKAFPYSDSRGFLSIGIGRNLTGVGLSGAEIDYLFGNDVAEACAVLDAKIPWWRALPPAQQRVMINLCFNMGWTTFSGFGRFLAAMQAQSWARAAGELADSLWYRQVGTRGPRMIARLTSITIGDQT